MAGNDRGVRIALVLAFAALAMAVAAVLASSPLVVAASNGAAVNRELLVGPGGARVCQGGERLPRATTAVRLSISAVYGPRVALSASAGGREIARGSRGSGWTADVVTVGVRRLARAYQDATVCFALDATGGGVTRIEGQAGAAPAAREPGGARLPGRVRLEYLTAGRSWLSSLSGIAQRIGLGRAGGGAWIAIFVATLLLLIAGLAGRLVLGELR